MRRLAERHGVSTDPPTVALDGERGVTPQDLGRSGGVVEAPATQDKSVISPPRDQSPNMPTVPDVNRRPDPSGQGDRTALQALLVAARGQ